MTAPISFVSRAALDGWCTPDPLTVELGPLTCLIGENGSGKTSIISGIEFAASGEAPRGDTQLTKGEETTGDARLLSISMHGSEARVVVTSDKGKVASCYIEHRDGSLKGPFPEGELSIRWPCAEVEEALKGTTGAAKILEWSGVNADTLREAVPAALRELFDEVRHSGTGPTTDLSELQSRVRRLNRKVGATIKTMEAELREPTGDGSTILVTEAEDALKQARAVLESVIRYEAWQQAASAPAVDTTGWEEELDAEKTRLAELRTSLGQWTAYREQLEPALVNALQMEVPQVDRKDALVWQLLQHLDPHLEMGQCPVCATRMQLGGIYAQVQAMMEAPHAATTARQAAIEAAQAPINQAEQTILQVGVAISTAEGRIRSLQDQLNAAQQAAAPAGEAPPTPATDLATARAHVEGWERALQARRTALREAEVFHERKQRISREKLHKQNCTDLGRALRNAAKKLSEGAIRRFEEIVNSRMPVGWTYRLVLKRFGKECFLRSVQLEGEDYIRYKPSGGQYLSMVMAEAAAMMELRREAPTQTKLHIYAPPKDRAWSASHLADTLEVLASNMPPGQVIIQSTVAPARTVQGAALVYLSEMQQAPPAEPAEPMLTERDAGAVVSLRERLAASAQADQPPPAEAPAPLPVEAAQTAPADTDETLAEPAASAAYRKVLQKYLKTQGKLQFRRLYKSEMGKSMPKKGLSYDDAISAMVAKKAESAVPSLVSTLLQIRVRDLPLSLPAIVSSTDDDSRMAAWLYLCPAPGNLQAVPEAVPTFIRAFLRELTPSPEELEAVRLEHPGKDPEALQVGEVRQLAAPVLG